MCHKFEPIENIDSVFAEIGREVVVSTKSKIERVTIPISTGNKFLEEYTPRCFGLYKCDIPFLKSPVYGTMEDIYLIIGVKVASGNKEYVPSYVLEKYQLPEDKLDMSDEKVQEIQAFANALIDEVAREDTDCHLKDIIKEVSKNTLLDIEKVQEIQVSTDDLRDKVTRDETDIHFQDIVKEISKNIPLDTEKEKILSGAINSFKERNTETEYPYFFQYQKYRNDLIRAHAYIVSVKEKEN